VIKLKKAKNKYRGIYAKKPTTVLDGCGLSNERQLKA